MAAIASSSAIATDGTASPLAGLTVARPSSPRPASSGPAPHRPGTARGPGAQRHRRVRPPRRPARPGRSAPAGSPRLRSGSCAAPPRDLRQRHDQAEHPEDHPHPPRPRRRDPRGGTSRSPGSRRPTSRGTANAERTRRGGGAAAQPCDDPEGAGRFPRRLELGAADGPPPRPLPRPGAHLPQDRREATLPDLRGDRAADRPGGLTALETRALWDSLFLTLPEVAELLEVVRSHATRP